MKNVIEETDHQQSDTALLSTIPLSALAFCLLWWVFLNPAAYTRAKATSNIQLQTRLYRAMLWLISTLLIGFSIIPVLGLTLGLAPGSDSLFPPHILLLILSGVWLVSFLYPSDDLLSPMRAISIGFIAFFVAFLTDAPVSMFCILIVGVTLFAFFEDDLLAATIGGKHRSNIIGLAIAVPILISIMLALVLSLVISPSGFVATVFIAMQAKESVKKQRSDWFIKLVFAALPVFYAALIWIYWFGGWRVLGA